MCGRFVFATNADDRQMVFPSFAFPDDVEPRYNIAPGQNIVAVANTGERRAAFFKWGLIPSWAKDAKIGNRMINARAETLAEKPAFRSAYRKRRCLIPATGFYEWQKLADGKTKIPMYISPKSSPAFAFAGLWESWRSPEGQDVASCTIVTTEPNTLMRAIHNRMPVILPPEAYDVWLDPEERSGKDLAGLLVPYPTEAMAAYPVSSRVNNPGNDDVGCIKPSAPPRQGALF